MRILCAMFLFLAMVTLAACEDPGGHKVTPVIAGNTGTPTDVEVPSDIGMDTTDDGVTDIADDDNGSTEPDITDAVKICTMGDPACEHIQPLVGKWCDDFEGCGFPIHLEFCPYDIGIRFFGSQHSLLGTVDFTGDTLPLIWGEFSEFSGKLYMFTLDLTESNKLWLREYEDVPLDDPTDFNPDDYEYVNDSLYRRGN